MTFPRSLPTFSLRSQRIVFKLLLAVTIVIAICTSQVFAETNRVQPLDITCLGSAYDLDLPAGPNVGFNPNNVSMQHLCAQRRYGGGPAGQNIGGHCVFGANKATRQVGFDIGGVVLDEGVNPVLANPRVMQGW